MVGLLDIADVGQHSSVTIRGQDVNVNGLSATHIAKLLTRFQQLQQLMDGQTLNAKELISLAPEAVGGIIAYGTGFDDAKDEEQFALAEAKALTFSAGEQIDFVLKIFDVTFGDKLNPFVKGLLARAGARVGQDASSRGPATKSPPPSRDSLRSATTPEMFGVTHQGNSPATPS
jgi:hypothetical protein